jgi:predicted nucleic acid-binding protein
VIYLDTSVVLATLFNEKRRPPPALWSELTMSSRLLEYEVIVRLYAVNAPAKAHRLAHAFFVNVTFSDLDAQTLARALQPFPVSVRTLDAIHLSTIMFLKSRGISIELATYDTRLAKAATALGIVLAPV